MSDIYLNTLVYDIPTIDEKLLIESTRVDTELAKKALIINQGAPSGIATLSATGKHTTIEIPFATNLEANTGARTDVLLTPASLKYIADYGYIKTLENRIAVLEAAVALL